MSLRMLVIEDSKADLDLTLQGLRRTSGPPFDVEAVETLKEAQERLAKTAYDIILADLNLPDSQGTDTIRRLSAGPHPPIVAHTGALGDNKGLEAIAAGAEDFIVKGSVDAARLRQVLEYTIQRSRIHGDGGLAREARLEQVVLERTRALQEASAQFHLATNSLSEVIFLAKIQPFQVLFVNDAYRTVFGRDPARLVADPFDWMRSLDPEDAERMRSLVAGDPALVPRYLRLRLAKTRPERWLQVHVETSRDAEGRPQYWAGAIQDVTGLVQAEEAERSLLESRRKLEVAVEADRFKADFLNMAAHELANPLTPLRLQVSSLGKVAAELQDPRLSAALQLMERNVSRLAGLVQDMLEVGRLQANSLALRLQESDLSALCREAMQGIGPLALNAGIRLEMDLSASLPARLDPDRIGQVLLNLLSNAVKYSPGGGRVTLRLRKEGREAVLEVTDTGRGIAPADVPLLFQPFVRVGDTRSVKGTGLGLYISRCIAEKHGGALSCQSPGLGQGSTFTVRIPLAGPPALDLSPSQVRREETMVAAAS